jgi:hypothetical protein
MKSSIILAVIIGLCSFEASAQDVLHLMINNKSIGEITTTSTPTVLQAQRSKYKNAKRVEFEYRQSQPVAVYKRSIEVTDDQGKSIYIVNESATKPGYYLISSASILSKMLKENVIKVYLMQNPRNNRMSLPSRRSLLVELHIK